MQFEFITSPKYYAMLSSHFTIRYSFWFACSLDRMFRLAWKISSQFIVNCLMLTQLLGQGIFGLLTEVLVHIFLVDTYP